METKSRTYRYFSTITLFISLMAIFFACVAFASFPSENIGGEWVVIFFLFVLSALCLYGTLFSTYSVAVTEKEIIAKYLWRRKILVWRGLDKIIPKSNGSFSLLNRDNNTKIFISSQFKGYLDLVDFIKQRRPDLFTFDHDGHFSRTVIRNILVITVSLLAIGFVGFTLYLIFIGKGSLLLNGSIIFLIGLSIYTLRGWSYSPQSFTLEGNTLVVNYLYKEVSYSADGISLIKLVNAGSLVGNSISVLIILKNKKLIKISGFQQGPLVSYFVLLQWHGKYAQSNLEYTNNHN